VWRDGDLQYGLHADGSGELYSYGRKLTILADQTTAQVTIDPTMDTTGERMRQ